MQLSRLFGELRFPALLAGGIFMTAAPAVMAAAPTGATLTPAVTTENFPAGTLVGTLSAVDPDVGDSHLFAFVEGENSLDNGGFYISGNQLFVLYGVTLDYDVEPRDLQIRLLVTDSTSQSVEQVISISVTDDRTEDKDGDGLSEMAEEDTHGTSDADYDSDGDGVGDGAELAATPPTSPTDANVWPQTSILAWGSSANHEQAAPFGGGVISLTTGQNHSLAIASGGAVEAWGGYDSYGQTTVPPGLANVAEVSAGGDFWLDDSGHSLALKNDGTVVGWGFSHDGKLVVPSGLGQVRAIATGRSHCVALKMDGSVVTWGHNPHGGIEPPAGLTDVVAVSARGFYSLALKSDGTVVAWGSNFDGTRWVDATSPVGLRDVVAISAGRFHSLALKQDGTVVAWGYNSHGQANVPAGLTDVVAVAAGGFHSMALKSNGSVVAWGSNTHGQTAVPPSAQGGVKLISAGILHSMAVIQNTLYPAITSSPRILSSPGAAVNHQVVVVNAQTLGFSATGLPPGLSIDPVTGLISGTTGPARNSVRIRVETDQGALSQSLWIGVSQGLPPTAVALNPPAVMENSLAGSVVGVLSATDPDAGDTHTYEWVDGPGSTDNGLFRIEGDQIVLDQAVTRDFEQNSAAFTIRVRARDASLNPYEQVIAIGFIDDRYEDADRDGLTEEQEEDVYLTSDAQYDSDGDGFGDGFEVARGSLPNSAASSPAGRILLGWGDNPDGRTDSPAGVQDVIDLAAGATHSVILKSNGTVQAWGGDSDGQSTVPEGLTGVIAVAAGDAHSLVLKSDGTVFAWGRNDLGQCTVPEGLGGVVAIAAGDFHNLALKNDGTVTAWGDDASGQCTVPPGLSQVVALAAGSAHSMALKSDGTVVVWGSSADGVSIVPAGLSGVVSIAAGGFHCLALKQDGSLVAWGANAMGQILIPVGIGSVTEIAAGRFHSIALRANGTSAAWGDNSYGQTGPPMEAVQIRKIAAGGFHNLALRQGSGFPAFADVSPVRSWPGEILTKAISFQNAVPSAFSAMGLPAGLEIHPSSGLVSGTITTGERRAVRISAVTDQGTLGRVIWFNTVDGVAPTDITLSAGPLMENSPAGTVVGSLAAVDSNAGDVHGFSMVQAAGAPDSLRFQVSGNQLLVFGKLTANYDAGVSQLVIRMAARDAGNNSFERNLTIQLADDRTEDADGDGINEAAEEDVLGSSDSVFDNFSVSDADRDGVAGLIEHAFNLNPKVAGPPLRLVAGAGSTAGLPAVNLVPAGPGLRRLRLEYLRRVGAGMTYTPQFSGGLGGADWSTASGPVTITPIDAQWERCVVEDSQTTTAASRRFARVRVSW